MAIDHSRQICASWTRYQGPSGIVEGTYTAAIAYFRETFREPRSEGNTRYGGRCQFLNVKGEGVVNIQVSRKGDPKKGFSALELEISFNASNPIGPAIVGERINRIMERMKQTVPLDRLVAVPIKV
ncbi:MAG TPA: hypothetical protein VJG90_02080 [Candidatus Nanoarchaeia archaeon]|nr:hypothetical protein [Candidatus Nanoarchaeia archaeon]